MTVSEIRSVTYSQAWGEFHPDTEVLHGLQSPQLDEDAYYKKLEDINSTFAIIRDPKTGLHFETGAVNPDKIQEQAVLFPSTHFSSLTHNVGNAIELALKGATNPNTAYIYVAYPGNGGSDNFPLEERGDFIKTSRFTKGYAYNAEGAQPTEIVQALARAVIDHYDTSPAHLSGDESGARLAIGLMSAFDENSVKDVYLNGPFGVADDASYVKSMLQEDLKGRIDQRKKEKAQDESQERDYLSSESKAEAKSLMPAIYKGIKHRELVLKTYSTALLANWVTNSKAYGSNNSLDDLGSHALFNDTLAGLVRQETIVTMQFNSEGFHDLQSCIKLGELIMNQLPDELRSDKRGVELILGSGGQDVHTAEPANRMIHERRALRSIATFMRLVRPAAEFMTEEIKPSQLSTRAA
jgi:hypothetical protein